MARRQDRVSAAPSFLGGKEPATDGHQPADRPVLRAGQRVGDGHLEQTGRLQAQRRLPGAGFTIKAITTTTSACCALMVEPARSSGENKEPRAWPGGVLSLSGGLVFLWHFEGLLKTLDADKRELWMSLRPAPASSHPVTWEQDGEQMIAVVCGTPPYFCGAATSQAGGSWAKVVPCGSSSCRLVKPGRAPHGHRFTPPRRPEGRPHVIASSIGAASSISLAGLASAAGHLRSHALFDQAVSTWVNGPDQTWKAFNKRSGLRQGPLRSRLIDRGHRRQRLARQLVRAQHYHLTPSTPPALPSSAR